MDDVGWAMRALRGLVVCAGCSVEPIEHFIERNNVEQPLLSSTETEREREREREREGEREISLLFLMDCL